MHNKAYMSPDVRTAFTRLETTLEPHLRRCCQPRDADLFQIRLERYFADFFCR